jgi:hypothetical protein
MHFQFTFIPALRGTAPMAGSLPASYMAERNDTIIELRAGNTLAAINCI